MNLLFFQSLKKNHMSFSTIVIKNCKIGKFTSKYKPNISLRDYLTRLGRCFQCSQECFIFALIYIDRLTENCSHFIVNSLNIHRFFNFENLEITQKKKNRLILLSIAIAAKFYDEKYFTNEYYAKVGGISLKEFNLLEVEFLHMIDYRLFVDEKLFVQYREKLALYEDKN